MKYEAFDKQLEFHNSSARTRGLFAGKRGGKTESGAVEAVVHTEQQIGFVDNDIDPYIGVIIAPTMDMVRRLSLKKFLAYAKPFSFTHNRANQEITWHNGSLIYCISADRPERLEGIKANWIWLDEVFQMKEQIYLEAQARLGDTQGRMWLTGSLGTQYQNPKNHWIYKSFHERDSKDRKAFEWSTADNPYFPKAELERLKDELDPRTFRQLFELDWNVPGTALVYDEFDEANLIKGHVYNPNLETIVSIDWGWTHPMACLFFQYDKIRNTVYLFDEIVSSRMRLDELWDRIKAKPYNINTYICDIAGNQEREQTGRSNIEWFRDKGIIFRYRKSAIQYGIPIVRSYIKNGKGQRKFFIDETRCPKSVDGMKNYSYPQKDGTITNENPIKQDDDCCDGIRYFYVNHLDPNSTKSEFGSLERWD